MAAIEGWYVTESGTRKYGRISFSKGVITKISAGRGKADTRFSPGCLIFPGFVDAHVHSREDKTRQWVYKEDFKSAGAAAINGGVTAYMEMPNTPEPVIKAEQWLSRVKLAKKAGIPVVMCCGINKDSRLVVGCNNYKAFLTKSVGDLYFEDTKQFAAQILRYKGKQLHVHCEDHHMIEHDDSRPSKAEVKAVRETIAMAKKFKAKVHICHLSTAAGAKLAKGARKVGITTEVTPHHLFFTLKDKEKNPLLKMNPPIRAKKDRDELMKMFKSGAIDCLATDHAPHTLEEKMSANPSGVPQLDTYGPFVTWLMVEKGFSLKRIADACAKNPAKLLGLNQGIIKKGMDASFTVLNLERPITISKKNLKTKCGWSPFEGITFPGSVEATIVKGKIHRISRKN